MTGNRVEMNEKFNIYELAVTFFSNLQNIPQGRKELERFNRDVQFELVDDESFYVQIKEGKVSVKKGICPLEKGEPIHLKLYKETMTELLKGRLYFSDVFSRYADDRDNRKKMIPIKGMAGGTFGGSYIGWVAKLVRMGQEAR